MFYIIIIIGVFLDLFTKNLAFKYLQENISLFSDFLYLKYAENTGVAFSTQIPGLKYLTVVLIIGVFFYYFSEKKAMNNLSFSKGVPEGGGIFNNNLLDLSFGLILAGAIGNGFERIFNGFVIDFIGVKYFSIFNLADTFISIGAILYLYILFKNKK